MASGWVRAGHLYFRVLDGDDEVTLSVTPAMYGGGRWVIACYRDGGAMTCETPYESVEAAKLEAERMFASPQFRKLDLSAAAAADWAALLRWTAWLPSVRNFSMYCDRNWWVLELHMEGGAGKTRYMAHSAETVLRVALTDLRKAGLVPPVTAVCASEQVAV